MAADFQIPIGWNGETRTFPTYRDNRHLVTFGPTRSGKGATTIVQSLLLVPHSCVVIDPKGQNAAVTARRRRELGQLVHFINPFKELGLGTSRFNPLAHLRIEQPNIVADLRSLADALIIPSPKDTHWTDSAVDLWHVMLLHAVATNPGAATLGDVRRMLTLPVVAGPKGQSFGDVVGEMTASPHGFIRQAAARFANVESREIQSVISTAITQTFFLDDPNIAACLGGSDFSMLQLKDKPTTVYLILPGRYLEAYSRFFRLLITSAIDQLTARPGGHPTLFLLDEFAKLQALPAVSKAFGFAAGYRVQLWAFLQDLPQLKAIYGDRWESFVANAGIVQFFTPADLTTAKYLQERGGMEKQIKRGQTHREVSEKEVDHGFTGIQDSYNEERVPLLPIETTMSLADDAQIVFFAGKHDPQIYRRKPYWKIERLNGLYDPDPFHSGP